MKKILTTLSVILLSLVFNSLYAQQRVDPEKFQHIADSVKQYLNPTASIGGRLRVESATISQNREMRITFSILLSDYPIREDNVSDIYSIAKKLLPSEYSHLELKLLCNRSPIEDLASKYYTHSNLSRIERRDKREHLPAGNASKEGKLVTNLSRPYEITNGLQNNHIALWQSHGYYYNQNELRWMWQRATIFETVEDLYTQSYVLPFLVPMLENAGANVLLPRERDTRKEEVIVDGDENNCDQRGLYAERDGNLAWKYSDKHGFANPKPFYVTGENPFTMGRARVIEQIYKSDKEIVRILESDKSIDNIGLNKDVSTAVWIASVPVNGEYAVYVSYQTLSNSSDKALYRVYHKGGTTDLTVNQKMGGGTWIYLGHFAFEKESQEHGVKLYNLTNERNNGVVVADAVKFGGGMGNIARKPADEGSLENVKSSSNATSSIKKLPFDVEAETSNYPRFTEGSRYWLQWAGFADTVYTPNKNMNDYNDDYQSRAFWVNALSGGSSKNPTAQGYNVPVDLSFAFHTDAGTTLNDSIIGTLMIYTRFSENKDKFPNGEPRINSREYGDIVQTQIVNDIRTLYNQDWSRRGLWDRSYFESRKPEVPAILLELLSHQNLADMRFGLDPKFRFDVCRAIYKGMLRYLSFKEGFDFVVQPLPPVSFSAEISNTKNRFPEITLNWRGISDPLEPTADPEGYIVYVRKYDPSMGDEFAAFDNGIFVKGESVTLPVERNFIYSFKVAAVNEGGISFPSEILSIGLTNEESSKTALIVNGFTRLSSPANFSTKDSTRAGFIGVIDYGVPYGYDISHIGSQYEFRRNVPWMTDNAPGFGASRRNYETEIIAGNTFDYPFSHGISILNQGFNFVSSSVSAVENGMISIDKYPVVDFIMGKQIKTNVGHFNERYDFEVYSHKLQKIITDYCQAGGNLIVSGSYIATDLWDSIFDKPVKRSELQGVNRVMKNNFNTHTELTNILNNLYSEVDKYKSEIDQHWMSQADSLLLSDLNEKIITIQTMIDSLQTNLKTLSGNISLFENAIDPDVRTKKFASETLKYKWVTQLASSTGEVKPAQNPFGFKGRYSFNTKPNSKIYSVESPDGLNPAGDGAWTIYRYADNNISAGIAYSGNYKSVVLGFPIETLDTRTQIDTIFKEIFDFFK